MRAAGSPRGASGDSGLQKLTSILETVLTRWTGFVYRHPLLVTAAVLLLAILAAVYCARNLGVDTDERDMFAADLQFRKDTAEFDRVFPRLDDPIAVVVQAPSRDEAEAFGRALVERLATHERYIRGAFAPSIDPFLLRNGLLYLGTKELDAVLRDLTNAFPLLEHLRRKPTLETFLAVLANAAENVERRGGDRAVFERICESLSNVIRARLAGTPHPLRRLAPPP